MEKGPYIGQMDRKIQIFTVVNTPNHIGEVKPVETLLAEPYAKFEDLKTASSSSEFVEGKVMHLMAAAFTIRYRSEIAESGTKMILKLDDLKFRIEHVMAIGRKKHLKLYVKNYE